MNLLITLDTIKAIETSTRKILKDKRKPDAKEVSEKIFELCRLGIWARDKAIPVLKHYASLPDNGYEISLGNGTTAMGLPLGYCPREAKEALEALPGVEK